MGSAKEYWDALAPPEPAEDGSGYEAWKKQVLDAAAVLELTGPGLSEEAVQQKLDLWSQRPEASTATEEWAPARCLPPGLPAFYEVVHSLGVAVRSSPSLDAEVLGVRHAGEVLVAAGHPEGQEGATRGDAAAWVQLLEPDGPGFMLGDGKLAGIDGPLLRWLPPESEKAAAALRRDLGRQLHHVELLTHGRVCLAQPLNRLWSRLPQTEHELPVEGRNATLPRAVALNAAAGLAAARGPEGEWRVLAARRSCRSDLVEACRLAPISGTPGESLLRHCLALEDGASWAVPMGYGALYRKAAEEEPSGALPGSCPPANCSASIAAWSGGKAADTVLLVRAERDILPGEEIVLPAGRPPREPDAWDGPVKPPVDLARSHAEDFGEATSGWLHWSQSPVHGAGVFALHSMPRHKVLEICPTLVVDKENRLAASDYSMGFRACVEGEEAVAVLPLGMGGLYNHGPAGMPPVEYWYDGSLDLVAMILAEDIEEGQELFIDYGELYWSNRGLKNPGRP